MTKAIGDVDACAEGIRKFTTEIFDTGVVMIAYLGMLWLRCPADAVGLSFHTAGLSSGSAAETANHPQQRRLQKQRQPAQRHGP
ncbi:MAG: hypothetical protein ACLSA6_10865 [Holdemania massiliensis]